MKYFIILLSFLILSSCGFIRILQVDKSNNEYVDEINRFLEKKNYVYDYSVMVVDSLINTLNDSIHKLEVYSEASAIQLRIYDSSGHLFSGFSQCSGGFDENKFLGRDFPPKRHLNENTNTSLKLINEFQLWDISNNDKREIEERVAEVDYVFVVYWSIWTNYFSRVVLNEVSSYARKFKNDNFIIIYANNARDIVNESN